MLAQGKDFPAQKYGVGVTDVMRIRQDSSYFFPQCTRLPCCYTDCSPFLAPAQDVRYMPDNFMPTSRTRVVREPDRGVYDRESVNSILDEGFLCHIGFVADGQPYVIPTSYGRDGDVLYVHGSAASRMLRNLNQGIPVCVTVTLLDGLVL